MIYKKTAVAAADRCVPCGLDARKHKIVFSSDHHAYHANIIKFSNRNFELGDWMGMNEEMRDKHNAVVEDNETYVFFLGDFAFPSRELIKADPKLRHTISDFTKTFKGKIFYAEGNHETFFRTVDLDWTRVPQLFELDIEDPEFDEPKHLSCTHYGGRSWNRSHYGAWQIYGHSHGGLKNDFGDLMQDWIYATSIDVGVDTNDLKPYTWEDIKKHLKQKIFRAVDHHSGKMSFSPRTDSA